MRATEVLAEPLVEVLTRLLTGTTRELYAVLWRADLLQVQHAAPTGSDSDALPLRPTG